MDSEYKLFIWIIVLMVAVPLVGMGVESYQKNNCRVELAKAGVAPEQIKELCK